MGCIAAHGRCRELSFRKSGTKGKRMSSFMSISSLDKLPNSCGLHTKEIISETMVVCTSLCLTAAYGCVITLMCHAKNGTLQQISCEIAPPSLLLWHWQQQTRAQIEECNFQTVPYCPSLRLSQTCPSSLPHSIFAGQLLCAAVHCTSAKTMLLVPYRPLSKHKAFRVTDILRREKVVKVEPKGPEKAGGSAVDSASSPASWHMWQYTMTPCWWTACILVLKLAVTTFRGKRSASVDRSMGQQQKQNWVRKQYSTAVTKYRGRLGAVVTLAGSSLAPTAYGGPSWSNYLKACCALQPWPSLT